MPRALGNSLGVATLTTLLALVIGLPGAYAVARLPLPASAAAARPSSRARLSQIATVSPLYLLMRALDLRDTWAVSSSCTPRSRCR